MFDRLRVLAHPAVAFPLWAIDLYVWHLPVLYQAALRHAGVHALEHAMFLGFGINMWMCLFGPLPMPSWFGNLGKLVYIVAVRLAGTVLGNIFLWSGTVFYPFYLHGERRHHISPLADQNIAGAIMMVEESLLTLGLFCWLFLRAAREGEERQELLDFAQAHGRGADRGARRARGRGRPRRRAAPASGGSAPARPSAAWRYPQHMCAGCAMAAASAATGLRTWLQNHHLGWLTPRRLRALTIAAMCAAGARLDDRLQRLERPARCPTGRPATALTGSRASAAAACAKPPATAGRIVSSAPSATGVARPSRKRMSSPAT